MRHILPDNRYVIFCRDVVSQVVIHDQTQQAIQQRYINLVKYFRQRRLHEHITFTMRSVPYILQIIDTIRPFVHQQRRRFLITRLDPCREQGTLIRFICQILIKVSICDLFNWLNVVCWHQLGERVEKLQTHFLEGALCQHESLDACQSLVRIVKCLFDQS